MKKTLTLIVLALVAFVFTSCVESSKKYKELLAEKEKLSAQYQELSNQNDASNAVINEIQNAIQAINEANEIMSMMDENANQGEQLAQQLAQIKQVMDANRQKLDSLDNVLAKQKKDNGYLRNTIKNLKNQITEKEAAIASLESTIAQKDTEIVALNTQVENLNTNVAELTTANEEAAELYKNTVDEMNMVYYLGASRRELKKKGILSYGEVLKQNVPTELFTQVDKREVNEITFAKKVRRVLSSHPAASYNLVNNEDGSTTLVINDKDAFWSVTKYLVVRTK